MVRIVIISAEKWNNFNGTINTQTFNNYLISVLSEYIKSQSEIENTTIIFPNCLTKLERYNIHKLNNLWDFKTQTYDKGDGRFIEVTLSKGYVNELFLNYDFDKPKVKTEKQLLFETMITFIKQNLSDEFEEYLNNI